MAEVITIFAEKIATGLIFGEGDPLDGERCCLVRHGWPAGGKAGFRERRY